MVNELNDSVLIVVLTIRIAGVIGAGVIRISRVISPVDGGEVKHMQRSFISWAGVSSIDLHWQLADWPRIFPWKSQQLRNPLRACIIS